MTNDTDDDDTDDDLLAIIGKTVAAIHRHAGTLYAPSGKDLEYAVADGEDVIETGEAVDGPALIEFTDGTMLLIRVESETTLDSSFSLDASLINADHPDAQEILRSRERLDARRQELGIDHASDESEKG